MLVDGQARRPTWRSSTRSGFARTTPARTWSPCAEGLRARLAPAAGQAQPLGGV